MSFLKWTTCHCTWIGDGNRVPNTAPDGVRNRYVEAYFHASICPWWIRAGLLHTQSMDAHMIFTHDVLISISCFPRLLSLYNMVEREHYVMVAFLCPHSGNEWFSKEHKMITPVNKKQVGTTDKNTHQRRHLSSSPLGLLKNLLH